MSKDDDRRAANKPSFIERVLYGERRILKIFRLIGLALSALLLFFSVVPGLTSAKERTPSDRDAFQLVLSAKELSVREGEAFGISAFAVSKNGARLNVTGKADWQASGGVTVLGAGSFKASKPGPALVAATFKGKKQSVRIVVLPKPEPTQPKWTLATDHVTLQAGTSSILTFVDSDSPVGNNPNLKWSSSDPSIVRVERGTLYGMKPGDAVVTLETAYGKQTVAVTVTPSPEKLTVMLKASEFNVVLTVGTPRSFSVTALYSDGTEEDVTAKADWTSLAPDLFSADHGTVTGQHAGNGVLKISYGNKNTYMNIKVSPTVPKQEPLPVPTPTPTPGDSPKPGPVPPVEHHEEHSDPTTGPGETKQLNRIQATEFNVVIKTGQTRSFAVYALYSDGSKEDVTTAADWTSLSPQLFSASGGTITGIQAGNGVVRITYQGFNQYMNVRVTNG
jgi:hypothetical protein